MITEFFGIIENYVYSHGITPEMWLVIVQIISFSITMGFLIFGLVIFWRFLSPILEKIFKGHEKLRKAALIAFWCFVIFYVLDYTNPINIGLWSFIFLATNKRKKITSVAVSQ